MLPVTSDTVIEDPFAGTVSRKLNVFGGGALYERWAVRKIDPASAVASMMALYTSGRKKRVPVGDVIWSRSLETVLPCVQVLASVEKIW